MAEAVQGGGPPVNPSEKFVLDALVSQLADEVRIIPNWTVVHADRLDECDAIVVTRDAVFIVETKFLVGEVEIGENDFWVDGSKRTHPYHLTHHKAQRLRTKLNDALPWFGSKGRVEAQVVLATRPRRLEVDPLMLGRVIGVPAIGATLNSPADRVHPNQVGRLAGRIDEVVAAITGAGRARERNKHHVDGYSIGEVIYEDESAGYFRAVGTSQVANVQHVLEVFRPLVGLSETDRKAWRMEKTAPYRFATRLGAHGALLSPTGVDEHDNGTVVLVWPMLGESALGVCLAQGAVTAPTEARAILRDIASALAHVHAGGASHRAVDPTHCAVRSDGRGVLRFGVALIPRDVGQVGDLRALGGLATVLAQRTGDDLLAAIAADLTAEGGPLVDAAAVALRLTDGIPVAVSGTPPLAEQFSDLEPLAKGDGVAVYAATDAGGARVAVKVLPGADSSSPDTWREYRLLANVDHPSIVRTLTAGLAAEGPYMVTDLLGGESLDSMEKQGRELDDTEKLAIAMQLLSALSTMHPDAVEIARLLESGDPEDAARADELRSAGVVHNDISPGNVRWIDGRRAVLFDFDMAGRLDSYVGELSKPYRPGDLPVDIAVPDADIYAVGAMLHELLTGVLPYEFDEDDRRIVRIDEKLDEPLREVLAIACAASRAERFATAEEFLEALIAAGIEIGDLGTGYDTLERLQRIEELIREGEFDAALEACDETWTRLRGRIESLIAVREGGAAVLLTVDGVELRRGITDVVENVNAASGRTHAVATAHHYQAVFPGGAYLDFAFLLAEDEEGPDRWMAGLHEVETHPRIKRLVQGLRPGTTLVSSDPLRVALRLRAAVLKPDKGPDWSTAVRVSALQLDDLAGFDVAEAVVSAGGNGYGTHEAVIADDSRNRADLCALLDPSTEEGRDAAAIGYFASRVMALFRTI